MIMNKKPYPISFEHDMSQALVCRYGEEMRQYVFKPDIDVSGLSCLLQIAKTDGTFTENGVEVHTDPDSGECTLIITIPQQATVVKGLNRYSICVYGEIEGENHLLYSAEGPLWVDDDLITDEMIASVAEVNGLEFPQDFLTVENLVDIVNYVAAEIIKDDTTSENTTWSSQKISDEIDGHTTPMALADLDDVEITSPTEGQALLFDDSDDKWKNGTLPDPSVVKEVTGNPIELTDAASAPLVKCVTQITGYQQGSGTPSPDNIRPIVAYTEGEIEARGKNCVKIPTTGGGIRNADGSVTRTVSGVTSGPIAILTSLPTGTYTYKNYSGLQAYVMFSASDYTHPVSQNEGTYTFTHVQGVYLRIITSDQSANTTITFKWQLEKGSTATTYEPYTSTTHSTTYPSAIYRGSEDYVGSEIENLAEVYSFTGNETIEQAGGNPFVFDIVAPAPFNINIGEDIARPWSHFNGINYKPAADMLDGEARQFTRSGSTTYFSFCNHNLSSVSDCAAWLAQQAANGTPVQLVPKKNPTTSSVTPTNLPIKSLSGYNHIESSTGDMELEYLTQTYDPITELIERSSLHVYSTEEKVVGKWIDKKDIYEKTFELLSEVTLTANQWNSITGVSLSGVETPISAEIRGSRGTSAANVDFMDSPVSVWGASGTEKVKSITFRYTKQ